MFKKRKILFATSVISLISVLFFSTVFALGIEIRPVAEGQDYYIMQLGKAQTFEACGFGWDENKEEKVADIEAGAIRWDFDSRFLQLIEKKGNTITLKAIKKRTSKLTVTGKINGEQVTKTIFIVTRNE